jgi:hypothetical protein
MAVLTGNNLLQAVALRILQQYLAKTGAESISVLSENGRTGDSTDIVCRMAGAGMRIKVKADPYCGNDPAKIADREFPLYRRQGTEYAFEAISNIVTREPGWIFNSDAGLIYYYFLAIGQTEDEINALMGESDEVLLHELRVERDDLHVIRMQELRAWFEANYESYAPRPVAFGDYSAWYRLVPRDVLQKAVVVDTVGPIFGFTAR